MDAVALNHILDYLAALGIGLFALFVIFSRRKSTMEFAWAILLLALSALFFSHSAAWQNGTAVLLETSAGRFEAMSGLSTWLAVLDFNFRQSSSLPSVYTLVPILALIINYGVMNYYFDARNFSLGVFVLQLMFIFIVSLIVSGFLFLGGVAIITRAQYATAAAILFVSLLCFLPMFKMLRIKRLI